MTTLTKIIVTTLLSLLFFSCNFDKGLNPVITGNGNVIEASRTIDATFNAIKATKWFGVQTTTKQYRMHS